MKAHFHKVPVAPQSSFSIRHDVKSYFGTTWHYHPELELVYTIKGEGVRLIGDNISNFSDDEMVLVGANLPHVWRCNEEYFQGNPDKQVEAIVIQFLPECLGRYLFGLPEAYLIPKLFEKAKSGLLITGKAKAKLAPLMRQAVLATDLDRIIIFLSILKVLSETTETQTIASEHHAFKQSNESDVQRINKVCNYTLSNYKKEITLDEIASISNLSVTSFCRYFKLITKKTYYDFLIEIRISQACRQLIEDKLPTEVVCFECGFNNVSNFYRHFKKITKMTPLEYKKKYLHSHKELAMAA
ncbi:AraC family transcriptional regulator [Hymenobacter properus]|uniref:AraC family transcriptional regulator n=1 Tax=Hymenobacter properus TaxID=2791026 RepID=A0A931BC53_9BACT|nr:AraC family transcriptional regulator [Hymenobacter properus]MBF9141069.1 AraC family transcriptional regulator [Hymenobacter properus]MBR7719878.1 AraC family transcriptional regulator [Microvirga sp. SRT04]